MNLGIELELSFLLIIQTILTIVFAKFEIETPIIKRLIKWLIIDSIVILVYLWIGHWAILVFMILLIPGCIVHFHWCKRHHIDPIKATPRKKLYKLRGWTWIE